MTGKQKPEVVEEPQPEATVVVHDYDPVRPNARRKNQTDEVDE